MSVRATPRLSQTWWAAAATAVAGIVVLAAVVPGDAPSDDGPGIVAAPAPVVAPVSAASATPTPPLLKPPAPPPVADAVAATADVFVGQWVDAAGQRLTVTQTLPDRYTLTLTTGDATESYDGVLRDGRVHFVRGIDGDWLQARAANRRCLYLGTGDLFCRPS